MEARPLRIHALLLDQVPGSTLEPQVLDALASDLETNGVLVTRAGFDCPNLLWLFDLASIILIPAGDVEPIAKLMPYPFNHKTIIIFGHYNRNDEARPFWNRHILHDTCFQTEVGSQNVRWTIFGTRADYWKNIYGLTMSDEVRSAMCKALNLPDPLPYAE